MTVKELIHELNKYHSFINMGHGGLTVSGGEPLLQHDFVSELMAAAQSKGFHTALDTSGFTTRTAAEKVLNSTDLVLLDIKSWIPELYQKLTHVSIEPTIDFARYLSEIKKPTWIRFVLVPGLTDSPANIHGLAKFCGSLSSIERVEILPFHKLGEHKWKLMGLNYELSQTQPPSLEQIEKAKSFFQTYVDCPVY